MEPWYRVVTPRKELREGRSLDPSEFAVHLDQIVAGTAPTDYREPAEFFKRNFFSAALTEHCGVVLRRLSGETSGTAPVLSLITQFGGGKTHTLAALYHLTKGGPAAVDYPGVRELLARIGLSAVPKARPAVFVGNAWDPSEGRETPWLDLAEQLVPDLGRRLLGPEARESAPGTTTIQRLLAMVDGPVLILFDEVLNYLGRYPRQADQFHSFVQNLTSALTATERAVGLLSLPASPTEMTGALYEWQTKLTKIVGRVGRPLIVNDPEEISEVVRLRLFEALGSPSVRQEAAKRFARWAFERRDRLPPEFANFPEEAIRRTCEACYPFHPSTLTVFQRKWQALPTFQQTRGTLAMLGLWVSRAFKEGYSLARHEPFLTLGSAPLSDREFRSKLLEQLGESRLEAAINFDIAGDNAHAVALDKETGNGVGASRLHQRVATAIFLESCGGMVPDKAATLPDLRFALGDTDTETTLVDTAVQALYSRCYFLRQVGSGGWRFGYKPTLRKVQADRKAGLDPTFVQKTIKEVIQQVFKQSPEVDVRFFPRETDPLPDRPVLTLVVLDPNEDGPGLAARLTEWTQNVGTTFRNYPGAILWLAAESGGRLRSAVEEWLAWDSTSRDAESGTLGELEPAEHQMIRDEQRRAKSDVVDSVWSIYDRLLLWNGKERALQSVRVDHMHDSEARSITAAIVARLRQEGLLNKEVGASYVERNWPPALKELGAWSLAGLKAAFFQGSLTRLERAEDALRQMLLRAVAQGNLGLGVGKDAASLDRVWFKEQVDPAEIVFDDETYVLLPARARQEMAPTPVPQRPGEEPQPSETLQPEEPGSPTTRPPLEPQPAGPTTIRWTGDLSREKWNLFGLRVLTKLAQSQSLQIKVDVQASVQDGSVVRQLNTAVEELGFRERFEETSD